MRLDLIQTVALAGLLLFVGHGLKRLIPVLTRYNIPAPVVGGLPMAALLTLGHNMGWPAPVFDTTLQTPLQNAFFASIGFGASLIVLRRGGPLVAIMMLVASVAAVLQNVVGGATAAVLGEHPLMGVLAGSTTLTGGPATGLAFAPLFEEAGVQGAATLAVSAAMAGIVSGGLIGGPIVAYLLRKRPLWIPVQPAKERLVSHVEERTAEPSETAPVGEDVQAYRLVKHLVLLAVAVGAGAWVSAGLQEMGLTLPAYIGAMIVAACIRNVDDWSGMIGMSQRTMDDIGDVALTLFLVMALMTLRLWELAGVVVPLFVILVVQIALVVALCVVVIPNIMGRDYDAVVMAGGFCGFMLGTTANAMANMGAIVERYGPAPKAYLVVPLVGAFGIDFVNGLLITTVINLWR
jgi:ESS family glutamate:Na+ symporter